VTPATTSPPAADAGLAHTAPKEASPRTSTESSSAASAASAKLEPMPELGSPPQQVTAEVRAGPAGDSAPVRLTVRAAQIDTEQEEADYALVLLHASAMPYNTYSCLADVNGPTIHVYPRGFTEPVFTARLTKVVAAGHTDLPMPMFALHSTAAGEAPRRGALDKKEHMAAAPIAPTFPDIPTDFVGSVLCAARARRRSH
jgi:hypothetical protein